MIRAVKAKRPGAANFSPGGVTMNLIRNKSAFVLVVLFLSVAIIFCGIATNPPLLARSQQRSFSSPSQESSSFVTQKLAAIAPVVEEAIQQRQMPGAVVEIGHDGHVVYRRALATGLAFLALRP